MASLHKQSSAGKPKLERRDAKKIDYRPSDSPRSAAVPSPLRVFEKNQSFRVLGLDSKGEIEKICEELGLTGGADAFSIAPEAWEAGKARSSSLDQFIRDHQARSKSLDEPHGRFFAGHGTGGELSSSPVSSTRSLRVSPFYNYNSMSSSSGDSFASDSSLVTGEKGFFGSLDTPRESVPVFSETLGSNDRQQPGNDRQQPGNAIQRVSDYGNHETPYLDGRKHTHEPKSRHRGDEHQSRSLFSLEGDRVACETHHLFDRKQTGNVADDPGIRVTHSYNISQTGKEMERVPIVLAQTTRSTIETNLQMLQPPPAFRVKSYLPSLSTQELIAGFGPDENDSNDRASDHDDTPRSGPDENDSNDRASDHDDTPRSDSEEHKGVVIEDKVKNFSFVSEVLQQHGLSGKEETVVDDTDTMTPTSPEQSSNLISIQSWRKLDLLGKGSFGTVYEGITEDGVYFAVKEVSLSDKDSKAQQCVTQLEQEIEVLSKFEHENIVRYLGSQKEPDKLYIFLELVTKGSLSSLYQKYTLFESQIRSYTRQILSGLKYLHERKVMHRDIKCANILVDVNGKIKVADFGLAKKISQLDELKSCKGSAYWMAPEVIIPKKTYSFPADIWSLGCTVLEMETRCPPFGDMEWHQALWKVGHGEGPPIPETLSEDAKDFIKRCLEVNPSKRPTARQLLDHPFVQYVGGTGLSPRNSFVQETSELAVIAEDKTLTG